MAKNLGAEAKGATQQAAEAILKGSGSQPIITVRTVFCIWICSVAKLCTDI